MDERVVSAPTSLTGRILLGLAVIAVAVLAIWVMRWKQVCP